MSIDRIFKIFRWDPIMIYSCLMVIVAFIFLIFPLSKKKDNTFATWCQEILEQTGFSGPPIIIREGNRNVIKSIDGIKHIYIKKQSSEAATKKILVTLIAYSTSNELKNCQYFTNLDMILSYIEREEGIDRETLMTL